MLRAIQMMPTRRPVITGLSVMPVASITPVTAPVATK